MRALQVVAVGVACICAGCGMLGGREEITVNVPQTISVRSSAFAEAAAIPSRFTCDGANVSPALEWSGVPDAAALALVVDDPDAPRGTFVHWVVVDIPVTAAGIGEGAVPAGAQQVLNDAGQPGYFGPCPPSGRHRYRFTVYALRTRLALGSKPSLRDALAAITREAVASGRLTGTYRRSR